MRKVVKFAAPLVGGGIVGVAMAMLLNLFAIETTFVQFAILIVMSILIAASAIAVVRLIPVGSMFRPSWRYKVDNGLIRIDAGGVIVAVAMFILVKAVGVETTTTQLITLMVAPIVITFVASAIDHWTGSNRTAL